MHPQFDAQALKKAKPVAVGLAASPGAACGKIAFTAEEAVERHNNGEEVVLVRLETSPEDIEGMAVAKGILTARGGRTSHAAVVARGMGRCCVAGCGELIINESEKTLKIKDKVYTSDDFLSLDGSTGLVYAEKIDTVPAQVSGDFGKIMAWANEVRRMKVRATPTPPTPSKQENSALRV